LLHTNVFLGVLTRVAPNSGVYKIFIFYP